MSWENLETPLHVKLPSRLNKDHSFLLETKLLSHLLGLPILQYDYDKSNFWENSQEKCCAPDVRRTFCASLCSRNPHGHVPKGCRPRARAIRPVRILLYNFIYRTTMIFASIAYPNFEEEAWDKEQMKAGQLT